MVHPRFRVVSGELPVAQALTPVYPTTAGLGQDTLRRLIGRALAAESLGELLPATLTDALGLPDFAAAVRLLHNPPPEVSQRLLQERTHPAWRRMKFDELLAQQLSMRVHYQRRRAAGAPVLRVKGALVNALLQRLPFRLTAAQNRVLAQVRDDLGQAHPRQRQDHCRCAGRAAVRGKRLPGGGDGAHRNPRRAALPQILGVAGAARGEGRVAIRQP
jgi:ATP-dependent DNA helicase RecG